MMNKSQVLGQNSGDEIVDETDQDDFVAPVQYAISSYGADFDVEGLVRRLQRNDIFIPPFQRDYVWNLADASRFIESLLLGLPVPGIFLARDSDSKKLLVIDGQQRLKTLQFFFSGAFNPKPNANQQRIFKLTNVQKQFLEKTYETLNDADRVLLNDTVIHATIVKQESPENDNSSVYHIFERLNTGGRKLSSQQIRVAIFHGRFMDEIRLMNQLASWRTIFGNDSPHLKDQELILRFLALFFEADNYKRPMNEFLNRFVQRYRNPGKKFLEKSEHVFSSAIDLALKSFGAKAFRLERALNAAVFDSVMVSLATRLENGAEVDCVKLKKAYSGLLDDPDYLNVVSQSTSDQKNVELRLIRAKEFFRQI